MSRPFQTKGEAPEWKLIYDTLLAHCDFGDVITHAQLDEVLNREFIQNRTPFYKANRALRENRQRWMEPVEGGYRVIEANEHLQAARRRKRKAKRQLGEMVKIGNATDISRLSAQELAEHDRQSQINNALFMIAYQHEQRLTRIEQLLRSEGKL